MRAPRLTPVIVALALLGATGACRGRASQTAAADSGVGGSASANATVDNVGQLLRQLPTRGPTLVYNFAWQHKVTLKRQALGLTQGDVELNGSLRLEALGLVENDHVLRATIDSIAFAKADILGKGGVGLSSSDLAAQVQGQAAYICMDSAGNVRSVRFAPDATALFKNTLQRIVAVMLVQSPRASSSSNPQWSQAERTVFGLASTDYVADASSVARKRTRYVEVDGLPPELDVALLKQRLTSAARIEYQDGHLSRMVDDEELTLVDDTDSVVLAAVSHVRVMLVSNTVNPSVVPPPALDSLETRDLWSVATDPGAKQKRLEARADGLTEERLVERVRNYAVLGKLSKQNKFFNRATALLQLHPELCATLVPVFHEEDTEYVGKAFILDLLVGTGHAEAQAALRTLLSTPDISEKKYWPILYQRIGLLTNPNDATAQFAAEAYRRQRVAPPAEIHEIPSDRDAGENIENPAERAWVGRVASTYALGSVAREVLRRGNAPLAQELHSLLVEDLKKATTGSELAAVLHGLGNAGIAADAESVVAHAQHQDPVVRRAAADALRLMEAPAAHRALFRLMTDPELDVATSALSSLAYMALSQDELRAVLRDIATAKANVGLDPAWIGWIRGKAPRRADAEAALAAIADRHANDSTLQTRAQVLLGELR